MKEKIERVQQVLKEHEINSWIVFCHHSYDIHSKYLLEKNITSATFIMIKQENKPIVITSRMESMMIDNDVYDVIAYKTRSELIELLKNSLSGLENGKKIAINYVPKDNLFDNFSMDILPAGTFEFLTSLNNNINWVSAKDIIRDVRSVKTKKEIENHRIAAKLAEELMEEVVEQKIKPGMTEKEIKALIEYECNKRGGIAFEAIVASGENSAIPHHHASKTKIKENQVLLIDYGVSYNWSNSDITRTYWIGKNPPEEVLRVYEAVDAAKEAAYKHIKAGVFASEVENAVRETMKEFGYDPEKYFIHSTGHPLGIETHDVGVGIYKASETVADKRLIENSVVTVEPGLYFEGKFGVRLEDDCVVTKDGSIRLSNTPKKIITI